MSRHIKLEIFDDAERCEDGFGACPYVSGYWGDKRILCDHFDTGLMTNEEGHALRCHECKAAEVGPEPVKRGAKERAWDAAFVHGYAHQSQYHEHEIAAAMARQYADDAAAEVEP